MKVNFSFSSLFAMSAILVSSAGNLIANEITSFFHNYLAEYHLQEAENQPVHLRNATQEKGSSFAEMTILDVSSTIHIETIAERILSGDPDVVHLANISTQGASHLYKMLQYTYSHFIHIPREKGGEFIASKYPLSQAAITQVEQKNSDRKEILEFSIHGANTYQAHICSNDLSMQITNSSEIAETTPVLLDDLPATLTFVKEEFTSLRLSQKTNLLAADTFHIVPIRRGGRDNDDRSGPYCEGRIEFKSGPNGTEWSVSGRAGYEDDRGNYVEGNISKNDKGETSGGVRGGYDKDK